ncbi:uncharacterized protein TERG_06308 [Trichophyton rubrum CBS 118892]|uniref:Uncharacterized protein n=1 Tax=Trichophyton rubrum (strain ATCC MYA-4607 / CBS 118892) TaxID=559305 RepID=A0A080WN48_TRIRC|nr:uncharacterized protein TERG_06308 [Trichophyton rubrum CBS 118892]KFL62242.1 hypothetical protein TERG_06308 [Trichophyton rubrum CBS 118892]
MVAKHTIGIGSAHPESLYKFLQRILQGEGINFIVAPYAASAQLAYLEKDPHRFIDAVFGPAELFLFDVEKIITKMDTDLRHFNWVTKSLCQEELGRLSNQQFADLCLLLGSPFLPTFPPFETPGYGGGKRVNIRDAVGMFNSAGRNALALCAQFEEDQRVHDLDYMDRFKRAFMTVKHHVIMDVDGKVGPLDPENASSDLHELIGQRLPEELYFYISKGILGSRIPNWLTSGELLLTLPLGTEDTPVYRRLLTETSLQSEHKRFAFCPTRSTAFIRQRSLTSEPGTMIKQINQSISRTFPQSKTQYPAGVWEASSC